MSLNRVQLNVKEILEKDFKTAMRGYNQEEVDEFLDKVIQDYEIFQQAIEKLQLENDRLKKHTPEQPRARVQPVVPQPTQPVQPTQQVNYDVIKRLSNLEKAVFGKKFMDSDTL